MGLQSTLLESPDGTREDPFEAPGSSGADRGGGLSHASSRGRDVLALVVVVGTGLAVLFPLLIHGRVIGETALLSGIGLTKQPGVSLHIYQNSDVVNSLIPWWYTVWQQVHHGNVPLWNPYAGLGMPLAFNWQSAPFSLPALVGYLVPVRDALTTGVVVDVVVAGSGGYVLGRVLGLGRIASASLAIVFELSGPFVAWFGYPFPAVISWSGWIFAFGLLILRQRHRAGSIVALALVVALAFYGGSPEGFFVVMFSAGVFFVYLLLRRARWLGGGGPIFRPALDLVVGVGAGCALAAPFALPGLQLASKSVRTSGGVHGAFHLQAALYLALPAFDGLPIFHGGRVTIVTPSYVYFYTETAMYVGAIALVLAGLAAVVARRDHRVQGFVLITLLCLGLIFVTPLDHLASKVPVLDRVGGLRALMPLVLALAVLAGFGTDAIARERRLTKSGRRLAAAFGLAGLLLLLLWVFGRGHLGPKLTSIRAHSFIWPAVGIGVGIVAAIVLLMAGRRATSASSRPLTKWAGPAVAVCLLAAESVFLVSQGATMMQSSTQLFPQTPAARGLVKAVGAHEMAQVASPECQLGLEPNVNDEYGVSQLDVYDPIVPKAFFTDWRSDTGTSPGVPGYNLFCPAIDSASVAREFGVSYLIQASGRPAPAGTVFVARLGDEDLYRVPGAGEATTIALTSGRLPPFSDAGTPVPVRHPSPSKWVVHTSSSSRQVLRLHLSNVPGWHASIDGRPLKLQPYGGMMLQAVVPPGHHVIVVHYWPTALSLGIVLAVASALFLIALLVASSLHRRGRLRFDRSRHLLPPRRGPAT